MANGAHIKWNLKNPLGSQWQRLERMIRPRVGSNTYPSYVRALNSKSTQQDVSCADNAHGLPLSHFHAAPYQLHDQGKFLHLSELQRPPYQLRMILKYDHYI